MEQITRKPLTRDAIEWTGENIREIQAFMFPHSPQLFIKPPSAKEFEPLQVGKHALRVTVFDSDATARYPSLGPQFATSEVYPGDWLYQRDGAFAVVRKAEFDAEWERNGDAAWAAATDH